MNEQKCACADFERLEGASVSAYIATFLENLGRETETARDLYRCRLCHQLWEKRTPRGASEQKRARLVKV